MQDATHYRQAVCRSAKDDTVIKFITGDKFTPGIQSLMENGDVYGAYFEKSGALVVEDRDGAKHYNVLADGSHSRKVKPASWLIVNPMTGADLGYNYKSRQSAAEQLKSVCDVVGVRYSQAVVMTENQWTKFKDQCQKPGLTESEQRALASKIVGYDY